MLQNRVHIIVLICALAVWAGAGDLAAESCRGGVLISKEIKPFIQVVKGAETHPDISLCRFFFDGQGKPYSLDSKTFGIDGRDWDFMMAVGPAAHRYLMASDFKGLLVSGMVLTPGDARSKEHPACGVSINLFTPAIIGRISRILPEAKTWAVFYNPDTNKIHPGVEKAMEKIERVSLLSVPIRSGTDIKRAISNTVKKADLIYFIPDATISSPALIRYIIKYTIARRTPCLGYNRFFSKEGAMLSIAVDYTKTGAAMAGLAKQYLETGTCIWKAPEAVLLYNPKVAKLTHTTVIEKEVNLWLSN